MFIFISKTLQIAGADVGLMRRSGMLRLAVLAVALVPAIYALIYLSSVWDSNAKTGVLPVALVNLDEGTRYQGQVVNIGVELSDALLVKGVFGWRHVTDVDVARNAVATGRLAFAVIIPRDFSEQAVPGAVAGGGKIRIRAIGRG